MERMTIQTIDLPSIDYPDFKVEKDAKVKIFVSIPTIGLMHTDAVHSILENLIDVVRLEPMGFRVVLAMIPRMLIAQARELTVEKALELNCDYIFFIDDDMIIPRGTFQRLYSHKKDIISALAFERMGDHNPNIYALSTFDKTLHQDIQQLSFRWKNVCAYKDMRGSDGLIKIDVVGFGCVLINTKIFKGENKLDPPYFMSQFQVGEDFFFCWKAKQKGFDIWCDTNCLLGHIGENLIITEKEYETNWRKRIKQEASDGNGERSDEGTSKLRSNLDSR